LGNEKYNILEELLVEMSKIKMYSTDLGVEAALSKSGFPARNPC